MATQLDLDYDSGAERSLPDEKADDKKPDKNRGRGQSSEVGNDNKRPCLADVVKWVGDIPFVQSGRTGKVHCGTTIINIRGTEEDKRVECESCSCDSGLTPMTFAAAECDCACHILARYYKQRKLCDAGRIPAGLARGTPETGCSAEKSTCHCLQFNYIISVRQSLINNSICPQHLALPAELRR